MHSTAGLCSGPSPLLLRRCVSPRLHCPPCLPAGSYLSHRTDCGIWQHSLWCGHPFTGSKRRGRGGGGGGRERVKEARRGGGRGRAEEEREGR